MDKTDLQMAANEALASIPFNTRIKYAYENIQKQLATLAEAKGKLEAKLREVELATARTEGSLEGLKQFMSMLEEEKDNEEVVVFGADQEPQARVGQVPDLS